VEGRAKPGANLPLRFLRPIKPPGFSPFFEYIEGFYITRRRHFAL
jgi:hypothetical protein